MQCEQKGIGYADVSAIEVKPHKRGVLKEGQ
jgi:hypothetical protein